ncbi:secreted RxLR effector protein 161-like [Beta vulgaris subsp. vulgaris]|uniref:secreted RxLR effector protein 161-like n=1 Tax=Beta vulgaris subsp. vulgaris TaxID=3555 RepID=UPI002546F9C8|nr:secreted RxLR effector protein 161-like [Beta vulgaris subsp. vulgaris]
MGELSFFLGLQIKQLDNGIMIHQQKYVKELLKKYGMEDSKTYPTPVPTALKLDRTKMESHFKAVKRILRYLRGTNNLYLWYPKGGNFDLIGFSDADYAGFLVDRKSTSGTATFLGPCLISWASKKQNSVALSTAEAEYVAAASCCAQVLWVRQQLRDFGVLIDNVPIMCDNTSAINISKNPVHIHVQSI